MYTKKASAQNLRSREVQRLSLVYSTIDLRPTGAQLWLNAWKEESADLPAKEKNIQNRFRALTVANCSCEI
jgi:hypothetical protein